MDLYRIVGDERVRKLNSFFFIIERDCLDTVNIAFKNIANGQH